MIPSPNNIASPKDKCKECYDRPECKETILNYVWKCKTAKLHFWWVLAVMTLAIIGLIVAFILIKTTNASRLMTFVSTTATILSIFLSVFAIMYTYTSNTQIERHFEQINHSAHTINEVSKDLSLTEQRLAQNLDDILTKLDDINNNIKTGPQNQAIPVPDPSSDNPSNTIDIQ